MDITITITEVANKQSFNVSDFTSMFNILLVILFFLYNQHYSKKKHDLEISSYWYRNILLPKHIEAINDYKNSVIQLTNNIQDIDDDDEFDLFYSAYTVIQEDFIRHTKMFSLFDPNLPNDFETITEEIEDYITSNYGSTNDNLITALTNDMLTICYKKDTVIHSSKNLKFIGSKK